MSDSATPWTTARQSPLSMGILQARIMEWVDTPFFRDLPNPGIKPRSPTLQVDSLPSKPPGKPKNTGVGSLSLLQGIFPTQELNWGLLNCRKILYQLIYQDAIIFNHRHLTSHLSITNILVMVSITDIVSIIRPLMLP